MNGLPTEVKIHLRGNWGPGEVVTRRVASTRRVSAEVEAEIEAAWAEVVRKAGRVLFDGPMARFEGISASGERLVIELSETSYKNFFVLHTMRQDLLGPETFGGDVAARPVGMSALVVSAEGDVLLGKRGDRVAYFPGRVHPFAGSLEPAEADDVFAGACRELREELGLALSEIVDPRLIGVVEDLTLRQPELVFCCGTTLETEEVRGRLDGVEHDALVVLKQGEVEAFLQSAAGLTPVCRGALTLLVERGIG